MAREEHAREDLLREATGLKQRIEFQIPNDPVAYVAGFRSGEAFCLYCGEDPVFQFNINGQLRRGFWQGCLLKAEQKKLVRMRRERTGTSESLLVSGELTAAEAAQFLDTFELRRRQIVTAIKADTVQVMGQVPEQENVLQRVGVWLASVPMPIDVAERPNVGG